MDSDDTELNDHVIGAGFDPRICLGTHPDVDSPCPKLNADATGIGGAIQKLVGAINQDTCGSCGCPLATMDMMDAPPTNDLCPRYDLHTNTGGSTW